MDLWWGRSETLRKLRKPSPKKVETTNGHTIRGINYNVTLIISTVLVSTACNKGFSKTSKGIYLTISLYTLWHL